ncbi:zona pellucida sperm-binding protein 3-like isoform X1 [Corythoichthys intestinalis]|uniref:zona pellucida sperm-binding protein 3-like isoform X1 n=1 Tax=Corythoichthys intestinalis TaxID=161448 RepID=UPI0025A61D8E|nr:zona pellucida sperm-binding protein 3-like isoform X1 [Corythoichthys intestinalis]
MNLSSRWTVFVFLAVFTLTESRRYPAQRPNFASGTVQSHFTSQQQEGARPKAVVVKCYSDSMELVVQADLFDTGLLVNPQHLRLGSDPAGGSLSCRASPTGDEGTLIILADLLDCGTRLSTTQDKIIYSNVLVYSPEPSEGLFRLEGATIPVECHFDRRYSVNGVSLHPAWVPSVSVASAANHLDFKLRLMTDNWMFERHSHAYFLGEPMHFEVSVLVRKHKPLRVYVEHCSATAGPDPNADLRYDFIDRNGCLSDAYLTNSGSHFLPRLEGHTLQFQVEAFRFHQERNSQVYITCWLRAVPAALAVTAQNRACSFIDNRWRSADGDHESCKTCDPLIASEGKSPATDTRVATNLGWNFAPNKAKQPTHTVHVHPGTFQSHESQQPPSDLRRETGYKAERIVQLGPLTIQ